MARNGLLYYNIDTDRYDDIRIRKLKRGCGLQGLAVYDYILCQIYKDKGYYVEFDDDMLFFVSEFAGIKESVIQEIVNVCCSVGLFDKGVLASAKVLTSRSIQERYLNACKSLKRDRTQTVEIDDRFNLIQDKSDICTDKQEICTDKTQDCTDKTAQNKIKEIKEIKERDCIEKAAVAVSPPAQDVSISESEKKREQVLPKRQRFQKPSVEEIAAYCSERQNGVDAQRFFDYHESKGWVIGKSQSPMKDWRAAVRTWERNDYQPLKTSNNEQTANNSADIRPAQPATATRPNYDDTF